MARYVMVVQSAANAGSDEAYNDWYDNIHKADILAIPEVLSGRRFDATSAMVGTAGQRYLSIYEVETDDPMTVLAAIGERAADGRIAPTETLDSKSAVLWFYKERD